jgi:pentapeptide MXKDX repeat protein
LYSTEKVWAFEGTLAAKIIATNAASENNIDTYTFLIGISPVWKFTDVPLGRRCDEQGPSSVNGLRWDTATTEGDDYLPCVGGGQHEISRGCEYRIAETSPACNFWPSPTSHPCPQVRACLTLQIENAFKERIMKSIFGSLTLACLLAASAASFGQDQMKQDPPKSDNSMQQDQMKNDQMKHDDMKKDKKSKKAAKKDQMKKDDMKKDDMKKDDMKKDDMKKDDMKHDDMKNDTKKDEMKNN